MPSRLHKALIHFWPILLVNFFFAWLFWTLLDTHILKDVNGTLSSFGSTWGDLPWHLSIIMGWSERGWEALRSDPVYAGVKLSYPFLPEVFTALFMKIGLGLRTSLIATTWPALVAITACVSLLAYRVSRSVWSASVAPLLLYLGGSVVGTWYFWQDYEDSGQGFWSFLQGNQTSYANMFDRGLHFTNIVADFLLPQRVIIFGFLVGTIALICLWKYWSENDLRALRFSALCVSALPLLHTHSFVALCIISGTLCVIDLFEMTVIKANADGKGNRPIPCPACLNACLKRWIVFWNIVTILTLPQLYLVFPQSSHSFLRFQVGWLAHDDNWVVFWLKNLGVYCFLIPLALVCTMWKERKLATTLLGQVPITNHLPMTTGHLSLTTSRPYPFSTFYLGFLAIFIVANLVVFQPWDWDNMKLFLWWFLGSILLITHAASFIASKVKSNMFRITYHLSIVTILLSLTSTGTLVLIRESGTTWPLFSNADQELANFVRANVPDDAVVLTSDRHDNPISALSGRQLFMGYKGWLWSHGIDYAKRETIVSSVYRGDPGTMEVLRDNGITHVLADPSEFFDRNLERAYSDAQSVLYEVPPIP